MEPPVELRAASATDLAYIGALARDPVVEAFLAPGSGEEERLRALLPEAVGGEPIGLLVIELPARGPVGALALRLISERSRIAELTRLMVSPEARGAGVATAAVRSACRRAFEEFGVHRVQAETYGDNTAGRRVFERAGFTHEGTRRRAYWRRERWVDGALFGLLDDELDR